MDNNKLMGSYYGILLGIVGIALVIIVSPHVPSWNDESVSVEYYADYSDKITVDIRLGDLDGYMGGIYRVGTALMLSNVFVTPNDPTVNKVYALLEERMAGMDDLEKADYLLAFVYRNVTYTTDGWLGMDDYVQMPAETLYLRSGDCEDVSFLLYTLYMKAGLDAVLIFSDDHVAVGVNVDCYGWQYITVDGKRYYSADATGYLKVGAIPFDESKAIIKAEVPLFGYLLLFLGLGGIIIIAILNNGQTRSKPLFVRKMEIGCNE